MQRDTITKKGFDKEAEKNYLNYIYESFDTSKILAKDEPFLIKNKNEYYEFGLILVKELIEISCRESPWKFYFELASSLYQHWNRNLSNKVLIERRIEPLENQMSIHKLKLEKLENCATLSQAESYDEEKQWPEFKIEEFDKIVKNIKGLEEAGEDEPIKLYHFMELESLLGKVERKARLTNLKYEARLAATLRDICKIHEPSELLDEQIKCLTGSIHALIEGWGELNREKVKWVRSRILEVGLTWLPVTEKAQKVIDEAKSTVK